MTEQQDFPLDSSVFVCLYLVVPVQMLIIATLEHLDLAVYGHWSFVIVGGLMQTYCVCSQPIQEHMGFSVRWGSYHVAGHKYLLIDNNHLILNPNPIMLTVCSS